MEGGAKTVFNGIAALIGFGLLAGASYCDRMEESVQESSGIQITTEQDQYGTMLGSVVAPSLNGFLKDLVSGDEETIEARINDLGTTGMLSLTELAPLYRVLAEDENNYLEIIVATIQSIELINEYGDKK